MTDLVASIYNISYTNRDEEHLCTNVHQRMVNFTTQVEIYTEVGVNALS